MPMKKRNRSPMRRVDLQVFLFTAAVVIVACSVHFIVGYHITYQNSIDTLDERVGALYEYVEEKLDVESFTELRDKEAMSGRLYTENQGLLTRARASSGVRYLYTATRTETGEFIYLLDGLPLDAQDFRCPGDPIEPEIIPELERAMAGEKVMPGGIKVTEWGKIFITYLPVYDGTRVIGVVGIEFDAESQYNTYFALRITAPLIIFFACIVAAALAVVFFRRISNPRRMDLYNTDQLTQLKSSSAFNVDFENWNERRGKLTVGMVLVDLNHLKKVNDQLGHPMGDEYLRLVAEALRAVCPGYGAAYRIGGDEMAIVLWDVGAAEAADLAAKVDEAFRQRKPDWPVETSLAVGYAVYDPATDENLYDTFKRADQRLYNDKNEHRRTV